MTEKHLPLLDLTGPLRKSRTGGANGSACSNTMSKERASIMFVRTHLNFCISPGWKKILVLSPQRAITLTRSLFASWISIFVLFFVSCTHRKGRLLTSLWYIYENKQGIVISALGWLSWQFVRFFNRPTNYC